MSEASEQVFQSDSPRIVVVDSSKVTRRLIDKAISASLPNAEVVSCQTGAEAVAAFEQGEVDLVTSAIVLPDQTGFELAAHIREHSPQRYIPIILVSGDVNQKLEQREISSDITDYFDKSDGFKALGAFVQGYVKPDVGVTGTILYVEDSRVVAVATRRIMESAGLEVTHVVSVEEALEIIDGNIESEQGAGFDVVLTDVYLKGGLTGQELVEKLRSDYKLGRRELPILVMTGDDNRRNQIALFKAGANDLVEKPMDEHLLLNKLRFQLQMSQGLGG
ncbi:MAG: response regulator [Xanthomonadales bacterium]|nr:response regulator [Xanthomonadales bacterium]